MTSFGTLTLFPANFSKESLRGILVWLYARFKGKQTTDAAKKSLHTMQQCVRTQWS